MRTKTMLVALVGLLAVSGLALPGVAEAQYYGPGYGPPPPHHPPSPWAFRHRIHGYVGAQLMGMGIMSQQLDSAGKLGPGGGFGLFGGLRLGPWIGLELNWTYTAHDESWGPNNENWAPAFLQVQTLTADFKLHIPLRGIFEPFFQVGGGFGFMGVNGDYYHEGYIFQSGPAYEIGGGGDIWLGPHFSLGGRILYRGLYFGESKYRTPTGLLVSENYIHGISIDLFGAFHF